ncbi:MAG: hypothetical protein CMJ76_04715 [Planctomycetaceae bacterium]|nr:hypothetical protein [Planctomycetaceae bacterium]|tara:strand:- start:2138 stop:3394 length:1257 start_codon:yes stop_codon:yes gene_type:complete
MTKRQLFWIICLISCLHTLVHVFELALPAVQDDLKIHYHTSDTVIGSLSSAFRWPWGLGALLVGFLVDKFGAPPMLIIYLVGCALLCFIISCGPGLDSLFGMFFVLGLFASIYHPAGLTLISLKTTPEQRPMALGIHGVFGSAGIALAPLVFALLQTNGMQWQGFFFVLGIIGVLGGVIFFALRRHLAIVPENEISITTDTNENSISTDEPDRDWHSFAILITLAAIQGMVYSGVITFFKDESFLKISLFSNWFDTSAEVKSQRSFLMAGIMLFGCLGQFVAGKIGNPQRLEQQLTIITLMNAPFLAGMAFFAGEWALLSAAIFAFVHFMFQPIYNSLVAKYTPREHRSVCYGLNFVMGFGVGSLGAVLAGWIKDTTNLNTNHVFAGLSIAASLFGVMLIILNRKTKIKAECQTHPKM